MNEISIKSPCCGGAPPPEDTHEHMHKTSFDYVLWGSAAAILAGLAGHFLNIPLPGIHIFAHAIIEFLGAMWWGIALGVIVVGVMSKIPQEYFTALLGDGKSASGLLKAAGAGVLLDLCSHGILMVGAKLYQRGVSLPQVMTFLIASPWNSLSLTLILIGLIGLPWTLVFIAGSLLIAIASGFIFQMLVARGVLPDNPNTLPPAADFNLRQDAKTRFKNTRFSPAFFANIFITGIRESRMLVRWLLLGIVIAAALRTFIPPDLFAEWLGPSLIGLGLTLIAATIIEVCSEGSAPIASDLLTRAAAPGNAFTFLMAGVATDYTEMMVLREVTKSWKIALFLPLVTVPQILLLGVIMNMMGG
jgi:uncharacterized membrane protein YraQ (UPF0718 family)